MAKIDYDKVPLKYRIKYNPQPDIYNFLYELVEFLVLEDKDTFSEWECKNKTKTRISSEISGDIAALETAGYVEKDGKSRYRLVSHPWM